MPADGPGQTHALPAQHCMDEEREEGQQWAVLRSSEGSGCSRRG